MPRPDTAGVKAAGKLLVSYSPMTVYLQVSEEPGHMTLTHALRNLQFLTCNSGMTWLHGTLVEIEGNYGKEDLAIKCVMTCK